MGPRQGFSPPPPFVAVPSFPYLSRSFLRRHRSPISFAHSSLEPSSLPRQGGCVVHSPRSTRICSSPNSTRAHVSTSSRDVVLHLCRKTWTRLWILSTMSAPKIRCPAEAFFIDAQSDQCHKAISPSLSIGYLLFRANPWSASQSYGCCGGYPGPLQPRGHVYPGAQLIHPWRDGPGPWRAQPGHASLSSTRFLVPLRKEG